MVHESWKVGRNNQRMCEDTLCVPVKTRTGVGTLCVPVIDGSF